ncbi:MAG: uroporphyrinogen decarboxylase [Firmicutes bacterium]|nr:uroporphyrinogen decarboxylase [Bacillota bacterium]
MNGKELVLAALEARPTPRVPWVPFTGVQIGSLRGYTATELLLSSDKLVECGIEAKRLYRTDGQPVIFDLQIEAEILGCELQWADEAPPSVISHPLASGYEPLENLAMPTPEDGRLPIVLDAMARLKEAIGEDTALYGLVCGPFTLAMHLRGTNLFLDMFDSPDQVKELIAKCREVTQTVAAYYVDAGMDVIAVVDPMISQISAEHFAEFVKTESRILFQALRELGVHSCYFVCGNATPLLAEMAQCGPDGISVDENVPLAEARKVAREYGISFGGNIPLTTVLLLGQPVDCIGMALELIENHNDTGFILSPGCDMPYNAPADNVAAISLAVLEPEKARQFVDMHEKREEVEVEVAMPDYENLTHPLIEVFTIDSATCPPCKYMVDATQRVAEHIAGPVDWVEHKATSPESIQRMKLLGVANLPTIVVNGKITFVSVIPDLPTYVKAVRAAQGQ